MTARSLRNFLPTPIRLWLTLLLLAMALLSVQRLLFMLVYPQFHRVLNAGELWSAWLTGWRFDLSTSLMTLAPAALLLLIPIPPRWRKFAGRAIYGVTLLLFIVALFILAGDLFYYKEAGQHPTFELKAARADVGAMWQQVLTEYPLHLAGLIAVWVGMGWLLRRLFRVFEHPQTFRPYRWWSWLLALALIPAITVVGVRGGFQLRPIRAAFAYSGDNALAGHLALNGWYTFVGSNFVKSGKVVSLMPDSVACDRMRRFLQTDRDRFLDPDYPLLRRTEAVSPIAAPGERVNVVLMVVESLTAAWLGSFGGSPATMPFLDSLAAQSVIFTSCYAVGTRSMEAMTAILTSLPNLMGTPFVESRYEQSRLRGMGSIFREQGYDTRFAYGAPEGSMSILPIIKIAGYNRNYSLKDYPREQNDGNWGVWDRFVLERMSAEMDTMREPFHYGIFTLSTHGPWLLPDDFTPPYPKSLKDAYVFNSFANLDLELKRFFERESLRPRFDHTIYVMIGDHTTNAPEGTPNRFRIGCLIYAPGRLEPRVVTAPVSQLDVLPTLIQLCGFSCDHSSFGHSMFDPDSSRDFAYVTQSDLVGWRRGNLMLLSSLERNIALFDPVADPLGRINLEPALPAVADSLRLELYAFYQTTEWVLSHNRVYPMVTGSSPPAK